MTAGAREQRDLVEEAVAALRRNRERILELAPCKVTLNLPPPASGRDEVVVEIAAKLK